MAIFFTKRIRRPTHRDFTKYHSNVANARPGQAQAMSQYHRNHKNAHQTYIMIIVAKPRKTPMFPEKSPSPPPKKTSVVCGEQRKRRCEPKKIRKLDVKPPNQTYSHKTLPRLFRGHTHGERQKPKPQAQNPKPKNRVLSKFRSIPKEEKGRGQKRPEPGRPGARFYLLAYLLAGYWKGTDGGVIEFTNFDATSYKAKFGRSIPGRKEG